jgi:hypothetical protein
MSVLSLRAPEGAKQSRKVRTFLDRHDRFAVSR